MTIKPNTIEDSGIIAELHAAMVQAIDAQLATGRIGKFDIKGTVKFNKERGKVEVKARVSVGLPQNDDDSLTKKYPSVVLMTVETDHPGQTRI